MEVFSRLEDRLIEAVKHMRDELSKLDDPPSYFDLEISVTGRVMDGELEVKFILQSGSYDKKTEGGSLENTFNAVSYTHLRAHETPEHLVCRLLLEKKK